MSSSLDRGRASIRASRDETRRCEAALESARLAAIENRVRGEVEAEKKRCAERARGRARGHSGNVDEYISPTRGGGGVGGGGGNGGGVGPSALAALSALSALAAAQRTGSQSDAVQAAAAFGHFHHEHVTGGISPSRAHSTPSPRMSPTFTFSALTTHTPPPPSSSTTRSLLTQQRPPSSPPLPPKNTMMMMTLTTTTNNNNNNNNKNNTATSRILPQAKSPSFSSTSSSLLPPPPPSPPLPSSVGWSLSSEIGVNMEADKDDDFTTTINQQRARSHFSAPAPPLPPPPPPPPPPLFIDVLSPSATTGLVSPSAYASAFALTSPPRTPSIAGGFISSGGEKEEGRSSPPLTRDAATSPRVMKAITGHEGDEVVVIGGVNNVATRNHRPLSSNAATGTSTGNGKGGEKVVVTNPLSNISLPVAKGETTSNSSNSGGSSIAAVKRWSLLRANQGLASATTTAIATPDTVNSDEDGDDDTNESGTTTTPTAHVRKTSMAAVVRAVVAVSQKAVSCRRAHGARGPIR